MSSSKPSAGERIGPAPAVIRLVAAFQPEHWFAAAAGAAALFILVSATDFSLRQALVAGAIAFLTSVPAGWVLVQLLLPHVGSLSTRTALIVLVGYTTSSTVGYVCGLAGLQNLYLPVCTALLVLAIVLWLRRSLGGEMSIGRIASTLVSTLEKIWDTPMPWVVLGIGFLSIIAVSPVLAPLVKVNPDYYVDYAFTDNYYHMIRAHILGLGAPLQIWPDMAGAQPQVYPDLHNFWVGQVAHISSASLYRVFFIFVPVAMVMSSSIVLYAAGKALTGSAWGGVLASALGYLILIPNPYDSNLFLRDAIDTWPEWTAARLHFLTFRSNMAYGAGWLVLAGVALVLVLYPHHRHTSSGVGLLTLGSVLIVALLRIRANFFVVTAPLYGLVLLGLLIKQRQLRYLLPLIAFLALFLFWYLESSSDYYAHDSSDLAVVYGPFGEAALPGLPKSVQPFVLALPALVRPLAAVASFVFLQMMGFWYGIAIATLLVQVARRRWRLRVVDWYLGGVILLTVLAATLVIKPALRNQGGDFGAQAAFIVGSASLLLAIVPLHRMARSAAHSAGMTGGKMRTTGLGLLLACTVVTYRGASATLHNQTLRAYPVKAAELTAYYWIRTRTPVTAIVAAHPDHIVTFHGQTIADTAYLAGVTERPAYLQFANVYHADEVQRRRDFLGQLFATTSLDEMRRLLAEATFDYLLVYADTPPKLDLQCCMQLVWDGEPKVYQR